MPIQNLYYVLAQYWANKDQKCRITAPYGIVTTVTYCKITQNNTSSESAERPNVVAYAIVIECDKGG